MVALIDRYEAAGLRSNPFAAPTQQGALGVAVESIFVDRSLPYPPPPGSTTLVQVIGDSGLGKSTQIQFWRKSTPGPYHYIVRRPYSQRWTRPPGAGVGPVSTTIYGDEVDRMPSALRLRWFRSLAKQNATLVIGTHVDLETLGRRVGFAVTTHRLRPVDHKTMGAMIDARLAAAAIDGRSMDSFTDAEIDRVMEESGGIPGEADVVCHQILAQRVL